MQEIERNKVLASRYRELLSIPGSLVALKMLADAGGFASVRRPRRRLTLCQQLAQTYYLGRSTLLQAGDMGCYACNEILGLGDLPKDAWKRYVGWMTLNEEVARKVIEAMPRLQKGKYSAAVLMPLERCPVEPDVVIFPGNTAQMAVVIGAYVHTRADVLTMRTMGMTTCAFLIALPMNEQRPSIVIPGNAPRLLAFPSLTELLCGLPGGMLEELAQNMESMRQKGTTRYPPAWQHIGLEPQPPIADILKDDGAPSWLK